jgi:hypothetical protein
VVRVKESQPDLDGSASCCAGVDVVLHQTRTKMHTNLGPKPASATVNRFLHLPYWHLQLVYGDSIITARHLHHGKQKSFRYPTFASVESLWLGHVMIPSAHQHPNHSSPCPNQERLILISVSSDAISVASRRTVGEKWLAWLSRLSTVFGLNSPLDSG